MYVNLFSIGFEFSLKKNGNNLYLRNSGNIIPKISDFTFTVNESCKGELLLYEVKSAAVFQTKQDKILTFKKC